MARNQIVKKVSEIREGKNCPYMDTIDRKSLDFDIEKVCSVSLVRQNVYACLSCGSFFHGRSKSTEAYFHSIDQSHHLFIHLSKGEVYCLPDGYQVKDPSLSDIKHLLNPSYSKEEIKTILYKESYSSSLEGVTFIPGRIGINNLGRTDHINSALQTLFAVPPLVEFFMSKENYESCNSRLVKSFGELTRKFFNPKSFKVQISPHEFLLVADEMSGGRFKAGKPGNVIDFLAWFLNELRRGLVGSKNGKRKRHSIISEIFRGVLIKSMQPKNTTTLKETSTKNKNLKKKMPFFFLSVELPPTPLYHGEEEEKFIPQVPIVNLLRKFNGETIVKDSAGNLFSFTVKNPPKYLILHIKRFIKNDFRAEKNPTIVNFPIKNLEPFKKLEEYDEKSLRKKSLKELLKKLSSDQTDKIKEQLGKEQLITKILSTQRRKWKYDLVSNIVHEGELFDDGVYRAFVRHRANGEWYETQDLSITQTMAQLVTVAESYVQVWERRH